MSQSLYAHSRDQCVHGIAFHVDDKPISQLFFSDWGRQCEKKRWKWIFRLEFQQSILMFEWFTHRFVCLLPSVHLHDDDDDDDNDDDP